MSRLVLRIHLVITFLALPATATMTCRQTHSTVLSSQQISSRVDALIAEQIRLQNGDLSDPSLFNQTRAYIENERHQLSQVVPDFEHVYKDRYLAIRDQLKQKYKAQKQQAQAEEQKQKEIIRTKQILEPTELFEKQFAGTVYDAQFTEDNKSIITSGRFGAVIMTEIRSRQELHTTHHTQLVRRTAQSPDKKFFITASGDGTAKIVEKATGDLWYEIKHKDLVKSARFSPDGKIAITGTQKGVVQVTDVMSKKMLYEFKEASQINSIEFSPDGTRFVIAIGNHTVKTFETATGNKLYSLPHSSTGQKPVMSPDGKYLVTKAHGTGTLVIVDLISGAFVRALEHDYAQISFSFSKDGQRLVTGSFDKKVRVFDLSSDQPLIEPTFFSSINTTDFSFDRKHILAATDNRELLIIDASTGVARYNIDHLHKIDILKQSRNGKFVLTTTKGDALRIIDIESGTEVYKRSYSSKIESADFSPNDNMVVVSLENGKVIVIRLYLEILD